MATSGYCDQVGQRYLTAVVFLVGTAVKINAGVAAPTANPFWENRIPLIDEKLHEAAAGASVDLKSAKRNCDDAYFGIFEAAEANMEIAIRSHLSAERAADLEAKFGEIRKQIIARKPRAEISAQIAQLDHALALAAKELDASQVKPQ